MGKKKEKRAGQEMFAAPPPGYRPATPAEEREIIDSGMRIRETQNQIALFNERIARHEAELRAARGDLQRVLAEAPIVDRQNKALQEKLKIEGKPGDIHADGSNRIYICINPARRIDPLAPAAAKDAKPEEKKADEKPVGMTVEIKDGTGKTVEKKDL